MRLFTCYTSIIAERGAGMRPHADGHLLWDGARLRPFSCEKRNRFFWNGLSMTPYLLFIFLWRDTDYAN